MIKKILIFLFAFFSLRITACAVPSVSARCAALMVADTGELIYGKNEHEQCGMASTTKIMTALLTLEYAQPEAEITVTEQMCRVEGTSMGLLPGDKVTYHDLVYGMLLASGNDAANTAAVSIAGNIADFVQMMNIRAKNIGMTNTNFVTPSGLDAENHYSTAFDMALLGCEAIRNPDFCDACSSKSAKLCYGNEPYVRYLSNHNKLLKSFDGAFGIKTGFTKKSGRCLVSAAERDGITLVCVTLNACNDWQDHSALLEYGFTVVGNKNITVASQLVDVFGADKSEVSTEPQSIIVSTFSSADTIKTEILLRPYTVAPVERGEILGEARLVQNGRVIKTVPIVSAETVQANTAEVLRKEEKIKQIFFKAKEFFRKIFVSIKERSGSQQLP